MVWNRRVFKNYPCNICNRYLYGFLCIEWNKKYGSGLDSVGLFTWSKLNADFFKVKFQSALPHIFEGMKGALGAAFGAMVVAEMMGASTGLGYIIVFSRNWFRMSDMFMAAIMIGLLYSLIYAVLSLIEDRLFRWRASGASSAVES